MEIAKERPLVGVGVMVLKGTKVLVGRRKGSHGDGQYAWPGGHLEHMESFEECARREVREEAGIEIGSVRFLRLMNLRKYQPKHYVDVMMVADWVSGEPVGKEHERIAEWDWYELDNLPQPCFATIPTAVEAYRTGQAFFDEPLTQ
jgi:8-oxo-dGTP diphosphatase